MTDVNQDRAAMPSAPPDIASQTGPAEEWPMLDAPTPHNVLLHWAIFALAFGGVMGGLMLIY